MEKVEDKRKFEGNDCSEECPYMYAIDKSNETMYHAECDCYGATIFAFPETNGKFSRIDVCCEDEVGEYLDCGDSV